MIDIKHLRANPDEYKRSVKLRGVKVDIDKLLETDERRSQLVTEVDRLRAELNVKGRPAEAELKKLQAAKNRLEKAKKALAELEQDYSDQIERVPNLLADDTPEGGEEARREESKWGQAEKKDLRDHLSLAESNGWVDFERGAKVAGAKFYFTQGSLARLNLALIRYAMDKAAQAGFTPMLVPNMVNSRVAAGTGFLPRGEENQIYSIEGDDLNLIATAEMPLTGYHSDEIIDPQDLPLLYAGYSPCYRREAGAYGKHSKGLFRTHQFEKVEMYIYCDPGDSEKWHRKMLDVEAEICRELEIPYRVVRIAAGDLGAPAYKKYDLEYWSPVDAEYRELTSCSNCTDYQARRLGIRTRTADGKTQFVHTLNGTAAVTSRMPVAILENHQTPEGRVRVPKALQNYFGGEWL